jgi:hypothetical protein
MRFWTFKKRLTVEKVETDPVAAMRDRLIELGFETFILIVKKGDDMVVTTNEVKISFLFQATDHLMRWTDGQPKGWQFLRMIMKKLLSRGGWDHASIPRQSLGQIGIISPKSSPGLILP